MAWAIDRLGRPIPRPEGDRQDPAAGKLMFQITGAFGEFERSMIRQRSNWVLSGRGFRASGSAGPRSATNCVAKPSANWAGVTVYIKVAKTVGLGGGTVAKIKGGAGSCTSSTLLPLTVAFGSRNHTGDSRVHNMTIPRMRFPKLHQGRMSLCSVRLPRKLQHWHRCPYSLRCWRCGYRCFQRFSVPNVRNSRRPQAASANPQCRTDPRTLELRLCYRRVSSSTLAANPGDNWLAGLFVVASLVHVVAVGASPRKTRRPWPFGTTGAFVIYALNQREPRDQATA